MSTSFQLWRDGTLPLFTLVHPSLERLFRVDLGPDLSMERGDDILMIEDRADRIQRFLCRSCAWVEILRHCRRCRGHREHDRLIVGESDLCFTRAHSARASGVKYR